jgi:plasmid stability protein
MSEIVLRDVDDVIVERLSERARQNGRSLEDESIAILVRAASNDLGPARESAATLRARLAGRQHSDSGELLAEDRGR